MEEVLSSKVVHMNGTRGAEFPKYEKPELGVDFNIVSFGASTESENRRNRSTLECELSTEHRPNVQVDTANHHEQPISPPSHIHARSSTDAPRPHSHLARPRIGTHACTPPHPSTSTRAAAWQFVTFSELSRLGRGRRSGWQSRCWSCERR